MDKEFNFKFDEIVQMFMRPLDFEDLENCPLREKNTTSCERKTTGHLLGNFLNVDFMLNCRRKFRINKIRFISLFS